MPGHSDALRNLPDGNADETEQSVKACSARSKHSVFAESGLFLRLKGGAASISASSRRLPFPFCGVLQR